MTLIWYFLHIFKILLISQGWPPKWTQIIALIFLEAIFFKLSTEIFWVFGSISTKIGFALILTTQAAEIKYDLGVTIILSFFLIPNDFKAISKATEPLDTVIEYLFPI